MKGIGNSFVTVVVALLVITVTAPILISLSHALVPVLIVGALAVALVKLVFFHTRRW